MIFTSEVMIMMEYKIARMKAAKRPPTQEFLHHLHTNQEFISDLSLFSFNYSLTILQDFQDLTAIRISEITKKSPADHTVTSSVSKMFPTPHPP